MFLFTSNVTGYQTGHSGKYLCCNLQCLTLGFVSTAMINILSLGLVLVGFVGYFIFYFS